PPTGHRPGAVVAADFSGDTKPDLATADSGANTVTYLVSICGQPTPTPAATRTPTRTPSPAPSPTYPSGTCSTLNFTRAPGAPFPVDNGPASAGVGDFNGDRKLDLVTSNFSANDTSLLLGNGSGGFGPAPTPYVSVGTGPQ